MGLYIHVPFCHSKCSYCAFYSVASVTLLEAWCDALCCEMEARSGELLFESLDEAPFDGDSSGGVSGGGVSSGGRPGDQLPSGGVSGGVQGGVRRGEMLHETLYFGGGTPSILPEGILRRICESLRRNYRIAEGAECTIEVNPEDVTEESVALWRELGFNRISIGVQSFSIEELAVASRRHSVEEALRAVECAKAGGFDNIGIDLILGLSDRSESAVAEVVKILRGLPITHISLYLLSIEEGSILYKRVSQGLFKPLDDDTEAGLYLKYCDAFRGLGFEHYEISNFAKPSFRSRHNSSYWRQLPYLGFGPAAHSYDGARRRHWNLPSLRQYLDYWSPGGNSDASIASGVTPCNSATPVASGASPTANGATPCGSATASASNSAPPAASGATPAANGATPCGSATASASNSAPPAASSAIPCNSSATTIPVTCATSRHKESLKSFATPKSPLQQSLDKEPNISCFEEEQLSDAELYNELIMTRLRTAEGLPLSLLQERGFERFWSVARSKAEEYISQGYAELRDGALILNERGWLISDAIFSDLFADTE